MIRNASANAITDANSGSKTRASTCSPSAPIARLAPVTPSCMAAMKRGGSATIRSTALRATVASLRELLDPRAPRRHERVLGRDEIAVQQDQRCHGDEFEEKDHVCAPSGGRLGMTSSSNRIYAEV